MKFRRSLCLSACLNALAANASALLTFTIQPISPAGPQYKLTNNVNANGVVVGAVTDGIVNATNSRAFRLSGRASTLLPFPPTSVPAQIFSVATAIHAASDIVGYSGDNFTGQFVAVRWRGNVASALSAPSGTLRAYALDVDPTGVVVGQYLGNGSHACTWPSGNVFQALQEPVNAVTSSAFAVRDDGAIVVGFGLASFQQGVCTGTKGQVQVVASPTADPFYAAGLATNGDVYGQRFVNAGSYFEPAAIIGGVATTLDGRLALDLNAYLATHPAALGAPFQAGDSLWLQTWYRDPAATKTTALSDALEVVWCP